MIRFSRKIISSPLLVIAFLIFSFVPSVVHAAIVHDSTSSATTASSQLKTLSWTHTTSGSERILIVGVSLNANTVVSSVTYAGLPLTKIVAYENGNANRVSLWYRLNPTIGAGTVSVTVAATSASFVAGASSYTGVNQVVPFGAPVTNRGTGTSGSVVVPSAVNEMVVDVLARRGDFATNPITPAGGQTPKWNTRTTLNNASTGITGGGSSKAGATSATMSWSWPASRAWSLAGISLKPFIPPADVVPPFRSNGLPSGILPSGTTESILSVQTDENATCRYDISSGKTYVQMVNTFGSTGGMSHSEQITGLINGATYSYYVRCIDFSGNQNGDDYIISFSVSSPPPPPPDVEPPSTPTSLIATALTSSQVGVSWNLSTDNVGVSGYRVFRDGVLIADISENSYPDSGLLSSTQYSYEVLAYDVAGNESLRAGPVYVTTLAEPPIPDTEAPSVPNNLVATVISTSEIHLSWESSTDNVSVAGYKVFRNGISVASVGSTLYQDTELLGGTEYSYAVSAIDTSDNESARTAEVLATTFLDPPPPDVSVPLRFNVLPSGILSSSTDVAELTLTTDENAICRFSTSADILFNDMINVFFDTGGTEHTHQVTGLTAGTEYNYYVRCIDGVGNANIDDIVISFSVAPFVDIEAPTIPQNIAVVSVTPTQVSFAWSESTDNVAVAGYKIFRDDELIATTLDTEYSDLGLIETTMYKYNISAYDAVFNESGKSESLLVTTTEFDVTAPNISDIVVHDITTTSAMVSWNTDEVATSRIEYGFTGSYGVEVFDNDLVTNHTLTLPVLSSGSTYHFRVRSTDGSNNTAFSVNQTFLTLFAPDTTAPGAVKDLSTAYIGQTFVDLFWTAPGDDDLIGQVASYDIRYSTNPITDSNWSSAVELNGEPVPTIAGSVQHYIVVGISPGTGYYFAMRSVDDVGNISNLSNVVSLVTLAEQSGGGGRNIDSIPPETPTEMQVDSAEDHILLRWKNPGDVDFVRVVIVRKEGERPLSLYDGIVVYEGDKETFTDINVKAGVVYYYGIFAYDREPNYSDVQVVQGQLKAGALQIDLLQTVTLQEDEAKLDETVGNEEETENYVRDNAVPVSSFRFTKALFGGMRNADVGELQKFLAKSKEIYPQGLVTEFFGELTRMAVRRFQCTYGIVCIGDEVTTGYGRVGPRTMAKLNELIANGSEMMAKGELILGTLAFGAQGIEVESLQKFLAKNHSMYTEGLVTGYFGNLTRTAVQRFQCNQNIVCEGDETTTGYGRVGPRTRAKINELYRGG